MNFPQPFRAAERNGKIRFRSGRLYRLFSLLSLWIIMVLTTTGMAQIPRNLAGGVPAFQTDGKEKNPWAEMDDDSIRTTDVPVGLKVWTIDPDFGTPRSARPDTLSHMFQNDAFTYGRTGRYNILGNLGSPRLSRIFTDRMVTMGGDPFIFAQPYDFFITQPGQLLFTNTKSPFMNITYHECGNKQNGEDRIRGVFSTNVNKRLGLGFKLDYLYGRGYYSSQSTAHFNGTLYGSYRGDRYQLHAMYYANHLKTAENGGIESDDYVKRPESFPTRYGTADMPTRLDKTWNKMNVNTFYLTHRYNLGFERVTDGEGRVVRKNTPVLKGKLLNSAVAWEDTLKATSSVGGRMTADSAAVRTTVSADAAADTVRYNYHFVPVASFLHTARIDHNNRRFLSNRIENAGNSAYFNDFFLPGDSANDFTSALSVNNLLAFELREGFNKWVKSALRLYARHTFDRFTLPALQERRDTYTENHVTLGAQLLKEQGHFFHYDVRGELRTSGSDWGEFNVEGRADFNVPLSGDTLQINLDGYVRNMEPSFYFRHYHARNAWWDVDLDKEFRARAGGSIGYKRTKVSVHFETLQNYTYFAERQVPYTASDGRSLARYGVDVRQFSKNAQLMAVTLNQDFTWGILNWENELTWQMTSSKDVLPLPVFSGYSNLYLRFRIAKVLATELGGDVRYFTAYYAPAYSPVIGQWCVQDAGQRVKIGNYPTVNVYANFHLKDTRFYVMASHVNYSSGSGNPFWAPHYPMNRLVFRLGISWNFFN